MQTPNTGTITANLLQELLSEAGRIAADAHDLLAPMGIARAQLRQGLLDRGMIVPIGDPNPPPISIAAVDGGSVREPLYVADLMVIVATSAEGMTSIGGHPLHQSHWTNIITHEADNERVLSAAMAAHELALLNRLGHDLRILDGSTTSPVLNLWSGLIARSTNARDMTIELITDEVLQSIHALGDPTNRTNPGRIVAMPKSDSSHHFMDHYRKTFGLTLPGGDRFMAAQVLNHGEMLYPREAIEHQFLPVSVNKDDPKHVQAMAADLASAVAPIRAAADERRLVVTYLKPESADTVLKAEVLVPEPLPIDPTTGETTSGLAEVQLVARYLSDETPGPHMQEPFAQYAVDLAAKSVSVGASALNQSMLASLPEGSESYMSLLVRSYRTSNSSGQSRPGAGTPRPGGGF